MLPGKYHDDLTVPVRGEVCGQQAKPVVIAALESHMLKRCFEEQKRFFSVLTACANEVLGQLGTSELIGFRATSKVPSEKLRKGSGSPFLLNPIFCALHVVHPLPVKFLYHGQLRTLGRARTPVLTADSTDSGVTLAPFTESDASLASKLRPLKTTGTSY